MMEDSTPNNPNGLAKEGKKSPSSSTEPRKTSPKDRKHRQDKKKCMDALENYFKLVTALELPKKKRNWNVVTQLVWSQIFEAWKLEKQHKSLMKLEKYAMKAGQIVKSACKQKALMELEEYEAKAGQIVKSARDAVEEAKIILNGLESMMQPLQQQLLDIRYRQLSSEVDSSVIKGYDLEDEEMNTSLQMLDCAPNLITSKGDVVAAELVNELAVLGRGIIAEFEKLFGHPANMKFSMPALQQPELNNNPNKIHRIRKKQGHIALKVFFYMYTDHLLPTAWKEAEELVKAKSNEAIEVGKKLKDISGPPEGAVTLEQTVVKSTFAAFEEAIRQVNDCNCRLRQAISSEVVVHDIDIQALGLDSLLVVSIQNGQSSMIHNLEWNEKVLWDLQNPPEPSDYAQMLALLKSLEATGYSSVTSSRVAPEADGDDKCWLMKICKLFPEIKKGGSFEVLPEIVNGVPQIELESMDLPGSKLKEKVDNTYPEVGALQQKLNQPEKMPIKKKGKRYA